jgi:hypothetical protein
VQKQQCGNGVDILRCLADVCDAPNQVGVMARVHRGQFRHSNRSDWTLGPPHRPSPLMEGKGKKALGHQSTALPEPVANPPAAAREPIAPSRADLLMRF